MFRKTLPVEVLSADEAKAYFEKSENVIDCNVEAADESRTMYIRISTKSKDRSGDIMEPQGVILKHYISNNVVAGFHKYDEPSVGRTLQFAVGENDIVAKMEFPPKGINPKADMLHDLYKAKFQHAASIGFNSTDYDKLPEGGYHFKTWDLYEYSLVLIPDNPEALSIVKSAGMNPQELIAEQTQALEKHEEIEKIKASEKSIKDFSVKELLEAVRSETRQKGVREVCSMAYLVSDIDYYIYWFTEKGVSESSINKLTQMLELGMEIIQEQATLETSVTETKGVTFKAGRTISKKNEALLKAASDSIMKVLESLGEEEEDDKKDGVPPQMKSETSNVATDFLLSLRKNVRKADHQNETVLKSLNDYLKDSKSKKEGGEK